MRLLVADGNIAKIRDRMAETAGATAAKSYADLLRELAPDAQVDTCTPADEAATPPANLASYDGVVITGSALNIYERQPASLRQIDFLRDVFELGIPSFGSCWGLQLAAVAAGGEVAPNPRGREVAFARKITLTEEGRRHPMHADRALSFDAPAIHLDEVVRLPAQTIVTAQNDIAQVQAAEIRSGNGVFWGVQYHPEYSLHDVAATIRRYGKRLVDEGFFHDLTELATYASELETLQHDRTRRDIAWRLGLGTEIIDDGKRVCEIANWIAHLVRPRARERK